MDMKTHQSIVKEYLMNIAMVHFFQMHTNNLGEANDSNCIFRKAKIDTHKSRRGCIKAIVQPFYSLFPEEVMNRY